MYSASHAVEWTDETRHESYRLYHQLLLIIENQFRLISYNLLHHHNILINEDEPGSCEGFDTSAAVAQIAVAAWAEDAHPKLFD